MCWTCHFRSKKSEFFVQFVQNYIIRSQQLGQKTELFLLVFFTIEKIWIVLVRCVFSRCVHTFFKDLDLSKGDKQVKRDKQLGQKKPNYIYWGFYNSKNLKCFEALFFSQFKKFELYWGAVFFFTIQRIWVVLVRCVFLRCVHTFFNELDLSKRDKQVKRDKQLGQKKTNYFFSCSLLFKEFELYWGAVFFTIQRIWIVLGRCVFFTIQRIWVVLVRCVFLRCVHNFFNDLDLSKGDKQVKRDKQLGQKKTELFLLVFCTIQSIWIIIGRCVFFTIQRIWIVLGRCVFFTSQRIWVVLVRCVFLRCVHTFFNDFDLWKRDKQEKPSGHSVSLEAQSGLQ